MTRRIHPLSTHLQPEEALTLIEFLDLLRDVLMQAYGDDITQLLQQATRGARPSRPPNEKEPF